MKLDSLGRKVTPEKFRKHMHSNLLKAGLFHSPYKVFGIMTLANVALAIVLSLVLLFYDFGNVLFLPLTITIMFFVLMALSAAGVYTYLDILIYRRVKAMENVFADFLTVVAENLRSGMTIDRSLWSAIKPEFGVLSKEIKIAAKKVMTGGDIDDALMDLANEYDSPMMKRALTLIAEALKSGSELADVIDQLADNIRESTILKKQMMANAVSYTIFISLIVIIIAPGLFALAYHLLAMMESFGESLSKTSSSQSMISFGQTAISLPNFQSFSKWCLAVIAFFSSLIVSTISKGDVKAGVKYVPIFILSSYAVYWVAMKILSAAFSGFLG